MVLGLTTDCVKLPDRSTRKSTVFVDQEINTKQERALTGQLTNVPTPTLNKQLRVVMLGRRCLNAQVKDSRIYIKYNVTIHFITIIVLGLFLIITFTINFILMICIPSY